MRKISIDKKKYVVPSTWNEFNAEQLEMLANFVDAGVSPMTLKINMMLFCTGFNVALETGTYSSEYYMFIIDKEFVVLSLEQIVQLASAFDFLMDSNGTLHSNLTVNMFLDEFPDKIFCDNALGNMIYEQFINLQLLQRKTDSETGFDRFIGVLISNPETFDTNKIDEYAAVAASLPKRVKICMLWMYNGTMNLIRNKFHKVFGGGVSSKEVTDSSIIDVQQNIMNVLANNDVTKIEDIRKSLMWDVFYSCQSLIEEYEMKMNALKQ